MFYLCEETKIIVKALLFINGVPPKSIPDLSEYDFICCTDGALTYLEKMDFPTERLDFISGDMDSYGEKVHEKYPEQFIETPDQDYTDFHKALDIILQKSRVKEVLVLGCSGGEMDHFLGNLTVAFAFKEKLEIIFEDEHSRYFFTKKEIELKGIQGKTVSLYPFPTAKGITSSGLHWEVKDYEMDIRDRIGTRNRADADEVRISYTEGDLVLFISH